MKEYKNLMKYGLLATGVVITTIEIIRVLKKKKEENNAIGDKTKESKRALIITAGSLCLVGSGIMFLSDKRNRNPCELTTQTESQPEKLSFFGKVGEGVIKTVHAFENVADKIIDVLKTEDEKNEPVKYYSSGKRSSYDDEDDDTYSRSSQYQDGDDYSKGVQDAIWGSDPTEPWNSDYMSGYDAWA